MTTCFFKFFNRKWSVSFETQNKHIFVFHLSIYRKFPPNIIKRCYNNFSKYFCTFQLKKKQVELKILIMAHRHSCQSSSSQEDVLLSNYLSSWSSSATFFCPPRRWFVLLRKNLSIYYDFKRVGPCFSLLLLELSFHFANLLQSFKWDKKSLFFRR